MSWPSEPTLIMDVARAIFIALEEYGNDEWAPHMMSFEEWLAQNHPDLVPLLDLLPPVQISESDLGSDEEEDEEDDDDEPTSYERWVAEHRPELIPLLQAHLQEKRAKKKP